MKKNRMMRIAAVMMVLALVTTCVISGSFAKYVTTGTAAEDTARVAKWGVTVTPSSSLDLFKTEYEADDSTLALTVAADEKVVAPGTKNEGAVMITLSGTPEVAVKVDFEGTLTLTGWEVDDAFYCPLIITVGTDEVDGSTYTSAAAFKADVEDLLNTSGEYAPGYNLSGQNAGKTISWEWPFEVDDEKDTALGNLETAPTISISLNATVTQVD